MLRNFIALTLSFFITTAALCQTSPKNPNSIINHPADHFMVQLAANFWGGEADSVSSHIKGFNRSANVYLMFDKPFKGNPQLSAAIGLGIGTSNISFKRMSLDLTSSRATLPFVNNDTGNRYKKYKLATAYLEVPVELRFSNNPETPNKSIKGAIGVKVGTLLNAKTKGKDLENSSGTKISNATFKEASKGYFNTTRLVATARVGYGVFSLFGAYNLTNVFKDGVAPETKLFQIGLTISGL